MDSSGFLSPKANAFSIAHLIDRAQLADLAFLRQNPNYHWNSQVLLREMEGISRARSDAILTHIARVINQCTQIAFPVVFLRVHYRLCL